MNKNGNPDNLVARQDGNLNALKSGVYSERARQREELRIRERLESLPLGQVLSDMLLDELFSLLVLRDLLVADLARHGVSNRKGEMRRQVGSRSRTHEQLLRLRSQIQLDLERLSRQKSDPPSPATSDPAAAWQERHDELRAIALAERSDVTCAEQIRAIEVLVAMPAPPKPNPLAALTDEELDAAMALEESRPAPAQSDTSSGGEPHPSDRDRLVEELHRIAVGERLSARAADRIRAVELLSRLDPPSVDVIRRDLAELTDEQLDEEVREFKAWIREFAVEHPELAREIDPTVVTTHNDSAHC